MDNTNINKTAVVDKQVSSDDTLSPVGSVQKEQGPPISSKGSDTLELIKPSEPELNIPTEVAKEGVEKVSDRVPLTEDHGVVGIRHAGESTPVSTQPSGLVNIPEIREVKEGLQISPIYSGRWLAELRKRVLKMFGLWKEK